MVIKSLLLAAWAVLPKNIKEDIRNFVIAQSVNAGTLATTVIWSLDGIWRILQILLVLISIGYTLTLWYKVRVELRKLRQDPSLKNEKTPPTFGG